MEACSSPLDYILVDSLLLLSLFDSIFKSHRTNYTNLIKSSRSNGLRQIYHHCHHCCTRKPFHYYRRCKCCYRYYDHSSGSWRRSSNSLFVRDYLPLVDYKLLDLYLPFSLFKKISNTIHKKNNYLLRISYILYHIL